MKNIEDNERDVPEMDRDEGPDERSFSERLSRMNIGFVVTGFKSDEVFNRFLQLTEDDLNQMDGKKVFVLDSGESVGMLVNVPLVKVDEFSRSVEDNLADAQATLVWVTGSTQKLFLGKNRNGRIFVAPYRRRENRDRDERPRRQFSFGSDR